MCHDLMHNFWSMRLRAMECLEDGIVADVILESDRRGIESHG